MKLLGHKVQDYQNFIKNMAFRFFTRNLMVRNSLLKLYSTDNSNKNLVDVSLNDKTGIATLTLQRPPVNGLNLELLRDISGALDNLESNRCRGLILTSGIKSIFSAGLDIMEMYKPNQERCKQFWMVLQDVWLNLYGSSFPTVAVINGHSPAGGCLLAMSCEYRVILPNFTIGLNETKLGIVAPHWFIASMHNTIGRRQAELALTTGHLFTSESALNVGLVDEIATNAEEATSKAVAFLLRFTKISPIARSLTKQSLRGADITHLVEHRQDDLDNFLNFVNQDKVQKGLEMYLAAMKKKQ